MSSLIQCEKERLLKDQLDTPALGQAIVIRQMFLTYRLPALGSVMRVWAYIQTCHKRVRKEPRVQKRCDYEALLPHIV